MISEQKLKDWTDIFLAYVREKTPEYHVTQEEGYKFKSVETFQKNFDIDDPDIASMLERSIETNNLVAGAMYFPKRMLLHFAQEYPEDTRKALRHLFDESRDIGTRLVETEEAFDMLLSKREKMVGKTGASFIGLRFLSLLLAFRYPERYDAMKPREWKVFCRYINNDFAIPNHTPIGEQYKMFCEYTDALRAYIKHLPQIQDLREKLTRGLAFNDDEFRWMTQDVIYVTARRFAKEKDSQAIGQPAEEKETALDEALEEPAAESGAEMTFPLEKYLEHFIIENWDNIDFGEPLDLYRDEDGMPGQQYTTDVGIIDILAKDPKGNFVVIELKRGKSTQHVIGQVLAYMGWVRNNLAINGQSVRGIVIVSEGNQALLEAQREVADKVSVKYYRVNLEIINPKKS